jgi:hypothetical protein
LETDQYETAADADSVTLRLSAGDMRRIIRALEQTSQSICGSPSGSRLAGTYMRLAENVRRQAEAG